ncbi:MAG: 23S rRNA (adenine(2503)-C(2))-methyltransferase RlmN [Treponema sp.]|nr:23S rRNA (adenine(2503)-C(2))-methyltransferase RlmN [Treponema sp.]
MEALPVLCGMPLAELAERLRPEPRFRAAQVFAWIARGARSFDEMSDLPAPLRARLAGSFLLRPQAAEQRLSDPDGSAKLALEFSDGRRAEAVLLSDSGSDGGRPRFTACLSTQAGCPCACVFCKTGSIGFKRNLGADEIVEQFLRLKSLALEKIGDSRGEARPVSNIVVMGMGEPLLNLDALSRALAVICDRQGENLSRRRICVSTCGLPAGIRALADGGLMAKPRAAPLARLALSLTTGDEELRRRLMPFTRAYPLSEVKEALRYFQARGGGRVTLEAALLRGINLREKDALETAKFARGIDAQINLIPWNPVKGLEFEGRALATPTPAEAAAYARRLRELGLAVTGRFRRARGIMGACGQLGE